jgi:hypothetical protein
VSTAYALTLETLQESADQLGPELPPFVIAKYLEFATQLDAHLSGGSANR